MQLSLGDPVCKLYGSFAVLSGRHLCMQLWFGAVKNFRCFGELHACGWSYEKALRKILRETRFLLRAHFTTGWLVSGAG